MRAGTDILAGVFKAVVGKPGFQKRREKRAEEKAAAKRKAQKEARKRMRRTKP